ncbi:MAG: lytic transglycosylase domain-containing protein [Canibacter sp.]
MNTRRIAGAGLTVLALLGVACVGVGLLVGKQDTDVDTARRSTPVKIAPVDQTTESAETKTSEPVTADPVWVHRMSESSGVPGRALAAYAGAALRMSIEQPGCNIGWNTLAAIGQVESEHGSLNGATLNADGFATPRIYGVPLDGTQFTAIPDTDGGSIDGDTTWDRAVGPMQFIPETWSLYGRDGNGDGKIDIDQIDDAALSAATLLCSEGGDLSIAENWITAIEAYNPSVDYNNDVAETADHFAAIEW